MKDTQELTGTKAIMNDIRSKVEEARDSMVPSNGDGLGPQQLLAEQVARLVEIVAWLADSAERGHVHRGDATPGLPMGYDSPDNNAWTRANLGLPAEPGDNDPLGLVRGLRVIQRVASGELGGDDEGAGDDIDLVQDIYWLASILLGEGNAVTPERETRIRAFLESGEESGKEQPHGGSERQGVRRWQ